MSLQDTRNEIITRALTLIGAISAGEEPDDADVNIAQDALNDLVKTWQATGAHLWTRRSATLFTQPNQIEYRFGEGSTDHVTESFTATTTSADLTTGDRVIPLTSKTGMTTGDTIGILTSTGVFWDTVVAVDPNVVLATFTGVPEDVDSGATVYYYSEDIGKALRVPDSRRYFGGSEIQMIQMGREDYLNLPNKQTPGTPVQFYYDPKKDYGLYYIWPAPTQLEQYINFTYYRPLGAFDDADDEADFPDEWIMALKYNLAVNIAPDIMAQEATQGVQSRAETYFNTALTWDQGDAPVFFQPSRWRR